MSLILKSLFLFFVTYILLKLFIPRAHRFNLIDVPNKRSSHKQPIARGAGIIFGFVFFIGIYIFYCFHEDNFYYTYALLSLLIVYGTGIFDDLFDISSRKKFIFIILATVLAYYDGFAITSLGNYLGYELSLGYLALPFTVFAVVGFTNAINLTDGLDGLAASISITILLSLLYIGVTYEDEMLTCLPILLIVPLLAFLVFNWSPAKVFMGDSGSLFLGFIIALLSIYALKYINTASILFLAAIPLLDTLMVMRRRKQRNQSLFVADKNHLHHILLNQKKDKTFTVLSLVKLQIIFGLMFIQVYDKSDFINLILFILLFIVFFKLFDPRGLHRKKTKKQNKQNKKTKTKKGTTTS
ncbi:MAG: MraY family glycosyltransferase [Campylobacterota bacterium]|nr:MraY family glycosyltransferase [Campylobacterota bacterium]